MKMARVLFRITAKTIVTEISVSLPATDLGKPGKVCAWMPGAAPPAASRIGANINKGQGIKAKVEDPGYVHTIPTPFADTFTF